MTRRREVEVGRFGLEPAPGGLRLVQSLVNTSLSGHQGDPEQDLLAKPGTANEWLSRALAEWSAVTGQHVAARTVRRADLEALGAFREQLRQALRAHAAHIEAPALREPGAVSTFDIGVTFHADGQLGYGTSASGWQQVAGLATAELLLARAAGTLTRLKTCSAPECGACFYDGSPNRIRVWHNTQMCGNLPNLRASRARRSAT
ncbi:CGNR zinc finger domain-containing protein [Amycolatopsis sp. NPDC051102]|uniref:CGNR zinc finger domain-containing protein n=1 Tax=Amycolatopsis sp. NPDC051102 TaxID=3155163 RepID=UPI00344701FB